MKRLRDTFRRRPKVSPEPSPPPPPPPRPEADPKPEPIGLGISVPGKGGRPRHLEPDDMLKRRKAKPEPSTEVLVVGTSYDGQPVTVNHPMSPERKLVAMRPSPQSSSESSPEKQRPGTSRAHSSAGAHNVDELHAESGEASIPDQPAESTATSAKAKPENRPRPPTSLGGPSFSLIGTRPGDDRLGLPSQLDLAGMKQSEWNRQRFSHVQARRRQSQRPEDATSEGATEV